MDRKPVAQLAAALLILAAGAAGAERQGEQGKSLTERYPQLPATPKEVARPEQRGGIAGSQRFELVKVAGGFADPINVVAANDGRGRLFVVERVGRISIVKDGKVLQKPFLDISDDVLSAMLEQGLYDVAFHPNFAKNGKFYVHFAELMRNGDSVVVEYTVSDNDPNKANVDSAELILQIDQPWANHNGGELAFGPDGYLYIGSGDGGWEGDPLEAGLDLSTLLGKILRIDVDVPKDSRRNYAIPKGNPFAQKEGLVKLFDIPEKTFAKLHTEARPEIWAYGLRNPWKFSFDPKNGDMYIADVGQNHWEEVDLMPAGARGLNFGWDRKMGTKCFPIDEPECADVGVLPVAEYPHEGGNCSVIGVGVYRGNRLGSLNGKYLFSDYCSGRIWATARDGERGWAMQKLLDTRLQVTGAGVDEQGELYLTSCNCNYGGPGASENPPGALWRLVAAGQVPKGAETAPRAAGADTGKRKGERAQEAQDQSDQGGQSGSNTPSGSGSGGAGSSTNGSASGQDGGVSQAVMDRGRKLFSQNCAVCHGGQGGGGSGPALAGNQNLSDAQHVVSQILAGKGAMPPFANVLTDQEIAAVATFVRNAWGNEFGPVEPADVASAR